MFGSASTRWLSGSLRGLREGDHLRAARGGRGWKRGAGEQRASRGSGLSAGVFGGLIAGVSGGLSAAQVGGADFSHVAGEVAQRSSSGPLASRGAFVLGWV